MNSPNGLIMSLGVCAKTIFIDCIVRVRFRLEGFVGEYGAVLFYFLEKIFRVLKIDGGVF